MGNTMTQLVIQVKYHADIPKLDFVGGAKSDWIDLYAAENVHMIPGDFYPISLGVSMKLPEGYEAHVVPRSSTFKRWGILQANSMGVIDNSYSGEYDIWRFPALATKVVDIHQGDRICQFRIEQKMPPVTFETVEHMSDPSRGGFGSTGR